METEIEVFPLEHANQALEALREGKNRERGYWCRRITGEVR